MAISGAGHGSTTPLKDETNMKVRTWTAAALTGLACAGALSGGVAVAQEQYFPTLTYRTGLYATNGIPFANGIADYYKLVNARGGINGVPITHEECETAYDTARSVECYERLKGRHGGAALFHTLTTGATFALSEKAPVDRIPLVTVGYGRSESADGSVFPWNFPLAGTYWVATDVIVQAIGTREGGLEKLRGKKIALVYHDSPFGKESLPVMQARSKELGFDLQLLPVIAASADQKSTWLQVRHAHSDYVVLYGWGAMSATALREAQATGYARDRIYGVWWAGAEPDVRAMGEDAKGYNAITLHHSADRGAPVIQDILEKVHGKGQGTGPRTEVGDVLYMRGVISAALGVEGVRAAQEKFGVGKVMTGEQVRWGLENLNLSREKLDALGFSGMLSPIKTSCKDHVGSRSARIHTWDGRQWVYSTDWFEADKNLLDRLVQETAGRYAREKNITPRTDAECTN